ncbi:unnamed protein product [Mesocestoides corti]|uniref:Uncharacterized protein n=2 Tax=Mesocestoides corti TaxID=53468 RepID=A0A158QT44_MESCO|nr:unnamed protein product [Mesocestoides corti]
MSGWSSLGNALGQLGVSSQMKPENRLLPTWSRRLDVITRWLPAAAVRCLLWLRLVCSPNWEFPGSWFIFTLTANGGGDVNRSQANQDIDSDRKECADLASRQRSLTNAATPSSGDAPAPETTLSDAEGPFCGVPGATSVGFISPLVADLKTAFLSRGEPMKSEETFDGIGVGLDVPDDCESGVD